MTRKDVEDYLKNVNPNIKIIYETNKAFIINNKLQKINVPHMYRVQDFKDKRISRFSEKKIVGFSITGSSLFKFELERESDGCFANLLSIDILVSSEIDDIVDFINKYDSSYYSIGELIRMYSSRHLLFVQYCINKKDKCGVDISEESC